MNPEKWVFIVGCYNSGTTLLHKLLASHPQVGSMGGEGQYYNKGLLLPANVGLPRLWAIEPDRFRMNEGTKTNENSQVLMNEWKPHFRNPKRPVLLEKSPTNAARMRWLNKEFPNAYFICIVRDGYAVAEGIHRKQGHDIELCARQWLNSNEIMLEDAKRVDRCFVVTYEDLVANPSKLVDRLTSFIGLESIDHALLSAKFRIHEQTTEIINMNKQSLDRLSTEERNKILKIAGKMLDDLGYHD